MNSAACNKRHIKQTLPILLSRLAFGVVTDDGGMKTEERTTSNEHHIINTEYRIANHFPCNWHLPYTPDIFLILCEPI